MTTIDLPRPPAPRAILVIEPKLDLEQLGRVRHDLVTAFDRDEWPAILNVGGPAYWLPMRDDAQELLEAAHTYITNFVSIDEAEIDGFDVEAWSHEVEQLLGASE